MGPGREPWPPTDAAYQLAVARTILDLSVARRRHDRTDALMGHDAGLDAALASLVRLAAAERSAPRVEPTTRDCRVIHGAREGAAHGA